MQPKPPSKVDKAFDGVEKIAKGCGWIGINFFILIFLCWGLYAGFVGIRVEMNGTVTEGYVSDFEIDEGRYTAIFRFEVNGKTYSFEDDTSANPPKYEIGEKVQVRYDTSNPNIAHIDSVFPVWLLPSCIVVAMFIIFIFINIYNWRAWKRGKDTIGM